MRLQSVALELNRMQEAILAVCGQIRLTDALDISVKNSQGYCERVTSADTAISQLLLAHARKVLPESYSEEDLPSQAITEQYCWQIDPLDGTDELIAKHIHHCGVSAALIELTASGRYQPVAGLLYLPYEDVMVKGDLSSNQLSIIEAGRLCQPPARDRSSLRGYVREIDPNQEVKAYYKALGDALGIAAQPINCGGAVHAFVSLILDRINVLCCNYTFSKEWDVSAAEPILKLMGGFLCDLDGSAFSYNKSDFLNHRGFLASISFSQSELMQARAKPALLGPTRQR